MTINGVAFIHLDTEDELSVLLCGSLCVCALKSLAKLKVARVYYYHGNFFPERREARIGVVDSHI